MLEENSAAPCNATVDGLGGICAGGLAGPVHRFLADNLLGLE
jgi:hypothetical protein